MAADGMLLTGMQGNTSVKITYKLNHYPSSNLNSVSVTYFPSHSEALRAPNREVHCGTRALPEMLILVKMCLGSKADKTDGTRWP